MTLRSLPKTLSLTIERLIEHSTYNKETGVFTANQASARKKIGDPIGRINSHGYMQISIDGVLHMAHRLAWMHVHLSHPAMDIDHRNLNKADNRFSNLRMASEIENGYNIPMKATNKAGFKGVYMRKKTGSWCAECKVNKKKYWLGTYKTAQEAGKAYDDFAKANHGDFYFQGGSGGAF